MNNWISAGKGKHGLRFREHNTLTTGVGRNKRPLRYYKAVFKWNNKIHTDAFGWENEFKGGTSEIEMLALQFKMNRKAGVPPYTFKEQQVNIQAELAAKESAVQAEVESKKRSELLLFDKAWERYKADNMHKSTISNEEGIYFKWIKAELGHKFLDQITLLDLKRIDRTMCEAGKAPRTRHHIKSIVRQVYNHSIEDEIYDGKLPTVKFHNKLVINNKRKRYLTPEEVAELLEALKPKSLKLYNIATVSAFTGMRFGEVTHLKWQHVNIQARKIYVMGSSSRKNKSHDRTVMMNGMVVEVFESLKKGAPNDYVFPSSKGTLITQVSNAFAKTVKELGFNDGIDDRRLKVVFHTLRHSCASWLANAGEELLTIARVLGHRNLEMTKRYSHINDDTVVGAMKSLDTQYQNRKQKDDSKVVNIKK